MQDFSISLVSSEKNIANLGERWLTQTIKQEGGTFTKNRNRFDGWKKSNYFLRTVAGICFKSKNGVPFRKRGRGPSSSSGYGKKSVILATLRVSRRVGIIFFEGRSYQVQ